MDESMDGSMDGSMDEQHREPVEALGLDPVAIARKRQPRALWAVLAAVAVAAGALVVTSSDDEGNQRPGLPVDLAGGSGIATAEAAADASIVGWVTYVPGDDLPALGGEATAYRLSGDVDEVQVRELADALGIAGEVQSDGPDAWWVAGEGGLGRLDVDAGGGAFWSYFAGYQDCASDDGSIGGCCDPGTRCATVHSDDAATPPAELAGEDEARAAALEVVAASGAEVEGARVTVDTGGESRSWGVTVEPVVDGIPSGLVSYVEVSESGVVLSGNGNLGAPEALGDYSRLDTMAVIERANAQFGTGTDGGGQAGADEPAVTVVATTGPCVVPHGADPSDGCGGTKGCDDDECLDTVTTVACKVQPDGREICEPDACAELSQTTLIACDPGACPQAVPHEDSTIGAPESIDCPPPAGQPVPQPHPMPEAPFEVVLVDAEPALTLLPATDGSADAYLVPAYRFTAEDGRTVDLPAVADDALADPRTTATTVPDAIEPEPEPVPEPQPCAALEEGDDTGTTHTIQTCPTPTEDPGALAPGEEPTIGVGYYVDVLTGVLEHCGWISVELGDRWWWADGIPYEERALWSRPTEGGTVTLFDEETAEFVGDAALRTKVVTLVPFPVDGDTDRPLCL